MTDCNMDTWKYYDITHKHHLLCNPMSTGKLDEVLALFDLKPGDRVLDIACGKGETLVRLAERYGISGAGVDISPYCVADAKRKLEGRAPNAEVEFLNMGGADYQPEKPESFDATMCIGASWVFKDHRGTLDALKDMTRPGGLLLVGEPFWAKEPEKAYLEFSEMPGDMWGSHRANVTIGEEEGLAPLYTAVSSHDDWDRYETLQWYAAARYATENPDDPDIPELLRRVARTRDEYLKWGRDTLGWALYLFRKPPVE